jgi:GNAT superfamily N-acetyltransferase
VTKIELLDTSHDRLSFDSGSAALDRYLRETARQHIAKGVSRTFVLVPQEAASAKPILGFFTLSTCEIPAEALPEKWTRRLPDKIPGIKLGRLAVARKHQGKGYGKWLLVVAIRRVAEAAQILGGVGLFVDAKDEQAARFYERSDFERLRPGGLNLFMPMQTLLQIAQSAT